ncbi:hypothetical protein BRADI_3g09625v3 [Brachypodium distachyon]|uniref:Uncharacterized protein n=1 Tax=Brachypodium distachyon TaxID=15368 RepID=A0A2K2CW84_BRADI|nr:hypothetical protein BRADI_3g09625v3 [Brachypodium distachyon]
MMARTVTSAFLISFLLGVAQCRVLGAEPSTTEGTSSVMGAQHDELGLPKPAAADASAQQRRFFRRTAGFRQERASSDSLRPAVRHRHHWRRDTTTSSVSAHRRRRIRTRTKACSPLVHRRRQWRATTTTTSKTWHAQGPGFSSTSRPPPLPCTAAAIVILTAAARGGGRGEGRFGEVVHGPREPVLAELHGLIDSLFYVGFEAALITHGPRLLDTVTRVACTLLPCRSGSTVYAFRVHVPRVLCLRLM